MEKNSNVYIAGHRGMVGSAILRKLENLGYTNLFYKTSEELDLRDRSKLRDFFKDIKPEYVFMAAALVGGIHANSTRPAEFLMDNIDIQNNIFRMSHEYGVKKMLYLGSACMMPRNAPQPMTEEMILAAPPEPTNEAYAIAKIQGVKACTYYNRQYSTKYIGVIPANCYGINDNFDPEKSHVIPALMRKFDVAKEKGEKSVLLWGTGKPIREFLYVDDLADACVFIMNNDTPDILNIGSSEEVSMLELAQMIKDVVGYEGDIQCDLSKPDGMPRRVVNSGLLDELGWKAGTDLKKGLEYTYNWYKKYIKR